MRATLFALLIASLLVAGCLQPSPTPSPSASPSPTMKPTPNVGVTATPTALPFSSNRFELSLGKTVTLDNGLRFDLLDVSSAGGKLQATVSISNSNGAILTKSVTGVGTQLVGGGITATVESINAGVFGKPASVSIAVQGATPTTTPVPTPTPSPSPSPTPTPVPSPTPPPLPQGLYTVNVLVIKYFPLASQNGSLHIDISVTGDVGESYEFIRQRTIDETNNLVWALSKQTQYLGYANPSAQPSISFAIVGTVEHNESVPQRPGSVAAEYRTIMMREDICNWVDNMGVRDVWLWAYQGPGTASHPNGYLQIAESKMSSPHGDVSNSNRANDMPICGHSYRVFTFNEGRFTGDAMESYGHQLEAEFSYWNNHLFRDLWQGPNYPPVLGQTGRCGSVHNPPNAQHEYDRDDKAPWQSDCLDWNPDGFGATTQISCTTWGCNFVTDWNNPVVNYLIWNWQNAPGLGNSKTFQGAGLRNWWEIHADWDAAVTQGKNLTV